MDSPNPAQPFRFLDLPVELRDDIYTLAIFDLPLPKPFRGLPYVLKSSEISEGDLNKGKLDMNILLANRLIFEEANSTILRRAQLVSVTVQGRQLCLHVIRALAGSRIVVLPTKYKSFCVLRHEMRDSRLEHHPDAAWEFVLCGRDMDHFCCGLMGDVHYFVSKPVDPATSHTFTLLSPKDGLSDDAPAFLVETKIQEKIFQPYHAHLRGFQNISIGATFPNTVDNNLETTLMSVIKSEASADPVKFGGEVVSLTHFAMKVISKGNLRLFFSLWLQSVKKFYSLIEDGTWLKLKLNGGEGYAEDIAAFWYLYISVQMTAITDAIRAVSESELTPVELRSEVLSPWLISIKAAYKISLCSATALRIPEWKPEPEEEANLNYQFALGMRPGGMAVSEPLRYAAIRRAMEILPDDEDIQRESQEYQVHSELMSARGWDTLTASDLNSYL